MAYTWLFVVISCSLLTIPGGCEDSDQSFPPDQGIINFNNAHHNEAILKIVSVHVNLR